jgi:hypothetical protein
MSGVWGVGCGVGCGVYSGVWGWVGVSGWEGGSSPLALEHSKVCTLCDFGHLQFLQMFMYIWYISQRVVNIW